MKKLAFTAMMAGLLAQNPALAQDSGAAPAAPVPPPPAMDSTTMTGMVGMTGATGPVHGTVTPIPPAPVDMVPANMENGRWYTAEGIPTFKIEDGKLDYVAFSGYRRYHAECHVCHGPDGEGSSYAPALKDSVMRMDYYDFQQTVASGKQNVGAGSANQVMPAFGTNRNVWCYVDDIYVYLRAHGSGAIPRGRPADKEKKSDEYTAQENACMEG